MIKSPQDAVLSRYSSCLIKLFWYSQTCFCFSQASLFTDMWFCCRRSPACFQCPKTARSPHGFTVRDCWTCLFLSRTVAGSLEVKMINSLPITLPLLPPTSADGAGSVRMLCLRCSSYFFVLQLAAELAVRHRVRAAGAFPHMPQLLLLKQRALAVLLAVPCSVAFPLPQQAEFKLV